MTDKTNSKSKKGLKTIAKQLAKSAKLHAAQSKKVKSILATNEISEKSNPRIPRKPGQPAGSKKHSDLYTDENPKGTIHGLGFKDVATAKSSVSKIRNSSRSHAHKIQAAVAMEQRAREMGKSSEAAVYRKFIDGMKKKTKQKVSEGSDKGGLRGWFEGGGWDRYDSKGNKIGKCGGRKPGEAKPKCFSKEKAAALGKKGRAQAVRRKRREDPNPNRRGAPIDTPSTKKGLKMRKDSSTEIYSDVYTKLAETIARTILEKKDACYHKVKASAKVWPSAYASGRLVQCRKKGASNYGKSKQNSSTDIIGDTLIEAFKEFCWGKVDEAGETKRRNKARQKAFKRNIGKIALNYERGAGGPRRKGKAQRDAESLAAGRAAMAGEKTSPHERDPKLTRRIRTAGQKASKHTPRK